MFEVSLGTLVGLIIGTGEEALVGSSLVLLLGYPLEYPNIRAELPVIMMGASLGLWFCYEAVRCQCLFRRLTDFHEATFWGLVMYFVTPYGVLITYNMNSLSY